jgi:glutamate--cysteine ligase
MLALPALWVGLLYDQNALDAAWDLAKGWSAETREGLRVAASVSGLQAEAGGVKMHDLARQVVAISRAGLAARGRIAGGADESRFLDVLDEDIASGQVQADRLLARYHGEWHGDLSHIYAATRL